LTGLKQKYIKLTDDAQFDDVTYISCLSYILVRNCPFVPHFIGIGVILMVLSMDVARVALAD
jgi:hypothetical protein